MRLCPHGFHHPEPGTNYAYSHSCDGCWCEGEHDRQQYGWPHDTTPTSLTYEEWLSKEGRV